MMTKSKNNMTHVLFFFFFIYLVPQRGLTDDRTYTDGNGGNSEKTIDGNKE